MGDSKFTPEFKGQISFTNGQYSVDGDIVMLMDELCGLVKGVYRWTLQGNNLFSELVEDESTERAFNLDNAIITPVSP
jgi:hypothetical protein